MTEPRAGSAAAIRNVVVLGCGRSGTSLVAGLLESTGVFNFGSKMLEPSALNPRGFFEDPRVNRVNEHLLSRFTPNYSPRFRFWPGYERSRGDRYEAGQRWLCALPADLDVRAARRERDAMVATLPPPPFCVKDPRFCYTLPAWRPVLGSHIVVCVFRHPGVTVSSILRAVRTDPGLRSMRMTAERAEAIWRACYEAAISRATTAGPDEPWLFLDYDLLLGDAGLERLAAFVSADVPSAFIDHDLARSSETEVSAGASALYAELTTRASS